MAKMPKKITIDYSQEKILVDGEEFPWHVSAEEPITVETTVRDSISTVRLTIFADAVEVIPAEPAVCEDE